MAHGILGRVAIVFDEGIVDAQNDIVGIGDDCRLLRPLESDGVNLALITS